MLKSFYKLVSISFILLISHSYIFAFENNDTKKYIPILGIDFGNTYIRIVVYMNGSLNVIPNELGSYATPNIITFTDKEILIGEAAKKQVSLNPKNTIYNLKRLIGRKFTDDKEFQKEKNLYPYDIINKDCDIFIQVEIMGEKKNIFTRKNIIYDFIYIISNNDFFIKDLLYSMTIR